MVSGEAGRAAGVGRWSSVAAAVEGAGRMLTRIAREPLTHFAVAGALLFAASQIYQSWTNTYRIVLTQRHIAQLANQYALQFGTQPTSATLDALVRRDIHDEILFREGAALKLDQGDEIVRRRVVQKMQFLMQDLNPPAEPTEVQLATFYRAHADRYVKPPQATFSHIFFSADRPHAEERAKAVLASLSNSVARAPDRGDPFPDLYDFSAYEPEQVLRLFGHSPFSTAVFSIAPQGWAGPFRSAYGWHLLYVDTRSAEALPPLSALRDTVRTDYLSDAQDKADADAFAKLAGKYTIVRESAR